MASFRSHARQEEVRLPSHIIDLAADEIRSATGEQVELRPRSLAVLRLLAENAGLLVRKNEIIAEVWGDVVVTDELVDAMHCRYSQGHWRSRAPDFAHSTASGLSVGPFSAQCGITCPHFRSPGPCCHSLYITGKRQGASLGHGGSKRNHQ